MSPKERLGLGGKVVKQTQDEVLPWEKYEPPMGESVSKRQGGVRDSLEGGKMRRLSVRLGRK